MEPINEHYNYEENNNIFYKKLKLDISKKQPTNVNNFVGKPPLTNYINPSVSLAEINSEKYVPSVISSPDVIVMSRYENAKWLNPSVNEVTYTNPFLLNQIMALNPQSINKSAQNKYFKEFYDIPGINNGFMDINEHAPIYNRRRYGKAYNI